MIKNGADPVIYLQHDDSRMVSIPVMHSPGLFEISLWPVPASRPLLCPITRY